MQMRPSTRFITGAWSNIYVRGNKPKRKQYMKPGRVVSVPVSQYLKEQANERELPQGGDNREVA